MADLGPEIPPTYWEEYSKLLEAALHGAWNNYPTAPSYPARNRILEQLQRNAAKQAHRMDEVTVMARTVTIEGDVEKWKEHE